jgi:hypothetical protein
VADRFLPAHDARDEPRDDIDDDDGRGLSARQDVIADRDLLVDERRDDPLVDALVPAAQEDDPRTRRKLLGQPGIRLPACGEAGRPAPPTGPGRLPPPEDGSGPRPSLQASEEPVVDLPVPVCV